MNIYNVIILDESGSMSSIYKETLLSMNEVLSGIRRNQEEFPEQHHYVTIVTFEGNGISGVKTRRDRVPIGSVEPFSEKDYRPGGCTPLYDAMGKTLMKETHIRPGLDLKIEVKEFQPRHFMYIRNFGPYQEIDYPSVFKRLYKYMFSHFVRLETPDFYSVYANDPSTTQPEKLVTDLGFCVRKAVTPKGAVGYREIPAGKYLCALYKGPYPGLSDVYDTVLGKTIPEMGLRLRDEPPMECYLNDPSKVKPEDLLTEIQIPVE